MSCAETRTTASDNTVSLEGVRLQIDKQPDRRTCEGLRVLVRRHLDGGIVCGLARAASVTMMPAGGACRPALPRAIFARHPPTVPLTRLVRVAPEPATAARSQAWPGQTPPPCSGARMTAHPGCGQITCQTHRRSIHVPNPSGQFTC
jgi:hypothetical protein